MRALLLAVCLSLTPLAAASAGPVRIIGSGVVTQPSPIGTTSVLLGKTEALPDGTIAAGARFDFSIVAVSVPGGAPLADASLAHLSVMGLPAFLDVPLDGAPTRLDGLTLAGDEASGAFTEIFQLTLLDLTVDDALDPAFLDLIPGSRAEVRVDLVCPVCLLLDNVPFTGRVDTLRVVPEPAGLALAPLASYLALVWNRRARRRRTGADGLARRR